MKKNELNIVFMGTPDFAVESLKAIIKSDRSVSAVVTSPDKPAGRGKSIKSSPVKEFALKNNLKVLQPANLKDPSFIDELKSLNVNLMVVVAFRMLPEVVWSLPEFGTLNLHASYLPEYRGAAPINWAIINGEKETGVTTFFINKDIDTGKILFREKIKIGDEETAGDLHDKLMISGAALVLQTLDAIESGTVNPLDQQVVLPGHTLKIAPKIFTADCHINWSDKVEKVYNFIRGLSPYPGAWTELIGEDGEKQVLKIFQAGKIVIGHNVNPGTIESDNRKLFRIAVKNGYIDVKNVQLAGKKRLDTEAFLRGFPDLMKYRLK